jgi:ATP-binding cassette subfamily B protein
LGGNPELNMSAPFKEYAFFSPGRRGVGQPGPEVTREQAGKTRADLRTVHRIIAAFKPYRWQVAFVLGTILAVTLVNLVGALLVRAVLDEAIGHHDLRRLFYYTAAMFIVPVAGSLIGFVQSWVNQRIGQSIIRDFRNRLFDHLQRMPLRFYAGTQAGEIQSRVTNDVNGVQSVLTNTMPSMVGNIATVVSSVAAMLYISPVLTVLSAGLLPVCFLLNQRAGRVRREINRERQKSYASLSSLLHETLSVSGTLLTKTFGQQERARRNFDLHTDSLFDLEIRQQVVGRQVSIIISAIFAALPAMVYLIGGWQLIRGTPLLGSMMTTGTLVAFTTLQMRFFGPATLLFNVQAEIHAALACFDRIFEYLDLPVEITDQAGAVPLDRKEMKGEIAFTNVTFVYKPGAYDSPAMADPIDSLTRHPQPAALREVSFVIPPGQVAALVGPSGAGKTTIAQLLPRLYDVTSGSVEIDGHDVHNITLASLSEHIGLVTQETFLLHTTIRENLLYARPDATEAEMIEAAKAAMIHDRILQCEEGYDTIVGERGYKLSGGEKQRLAIARVLLKNPRILILDEATSALDTHSERLVQEALARLWVGRTVLVIAHRLSTVVNADIIFVVDKGEIRERGTHRELLAREGLYAHLQQQQFSPIPVPS